MRNAGQNEHTRHTNVLSCWISDDNSFMVVSATCSRLKAPASTASSAFICATTMQILCELQSEIIN